MVESRAGRHHAAVKLHPKCSSCFLGHQDTKKHKRLPRFWTLEGLSDFKPGRNKVRELAVTEFASRVVTIKTRAYNPVLSRSVGTGPRVIVITDPMSMVRAR
jgi:hypothetical protein